MSEVVNSLLQYSPAIITAGIALATFFETKRGRKTQEIVDEAIKPLIKGREENRKGIEELTKVVDEIRGDTVRLQLNDLIERDPNNIDTILKVAEFYFIDIKKNWWMASKFKHWAHQHDVDVPDHLLYVVNHEHEKHK